MRGLLRALYTRLGLPRRRRPYRPDFTDKTFFAALAPAAKEYRDLVGAVAALEADDRRGAVAMTVEYFRRRERPRFLIDIGAIGGALERIEQAHPDWRRRAIEGSERDATQGFAVLGMQPVQLMTTRGWNRQILGPGRDLLHGVRPQFFEFAPRMARAAAYGTSAGVSLERIVAVWMRLPRGRARRLRYMSDLTVGLRILALSWAWAFLAAAAVHRTARYEALEFDLLKILRADGEFLEPLVEDAVPNNHKLTAAFVLWYVGTVFPELAGGHDWRSQGREVWLAEFDRQTYADGGSFEHSVGYHQTVCEMAAVFILLGGRNGEAIPDWVMERTRRALDFHVTVGEAHPRPFGDWSEYALFPLDPWSGWTTASIRELSRAMFGARHAGGNLTDARVEQAFWLLGGALSPVRNDTSPFFELREFPDTGCYVFASREPGTRLLFRTGPAPERRVFAGHMHADLLSIYLTIRGVPVIVEAGTYTYRTAAGEWRAHFAGPACHNGLVIDGHDPLGAVAGDFRPSDVTARVVSRSEAAAGVMLWAEGEARGTGMSTGYRRGVVGLDLGFWMIYDLLPDQARLQHVGYGLQLEPGCRVDDRDDGGVTIRADVQEVSIVTSDGLRRPTIASGQLTPPKGWVSPSYGQLVPAPHVHFGNNGTRHCTAFVISDDQRVPRCRSVGVELLPNGSTSIVVEWADCTDRVVIGAHGRPTPLLGGHFDGVVLWVRTRGVQPVLLRWLSGRSVYLPEVSVDVRTPGTATSLAVTMTDDGLITAGTGAGVASVRWPARPGRRE